MMLFLLAACCLPTGELGGSVQQARSAPALPPAPARLGAPADSLAARPDWASSNAYAPQASDEVFGLVDPARGPLREGLLACEVSSTHIENHIRKRNNAPDLNVRLMWGEHEVHVRGADNSSTVRVTAPLVSLSDNETVTARVWDRGLVLKRQLGDVSFPYVGMPAVGQGAGLTLSCGYVDRNALEDLLERELEEAGQAVMSWPDQVDLEAEIVSPEGQGGAARSAVERAAGLVGWADVRVQARARLYGERRAQHLGAVRSAVEQRRNSLPDGWSTVGALQWAPGTIRSDGTNLIVQLPVEGQAEPFAGVFGDLSEVQLIDSEGDAATLNFDGIGGQGSAPLRGRDTAVFQTIVSDPVAWKPPFLIRSRVAGAWVWQRVDPKS